MIAKVSALVAATGAALVVAGSLGPWLVVAPAAPFVVSVQESEPLVPRGWLGLLALVALAAVALGVAATGRRGAALPAVALCLGLVYVYGEVINPRIVLWFGLVALVAAGLAASGTRGVAWLAIPFCVGAALVAGAFWWIVRRQLRPPSWLDLPEVLTPIVPDFTEAVVGPGWGLYAVVVGGLLGGIMAGVSALTEGFTDRDRR